MSRWILYCPACKRQFGHSEIPVNAPRDGFLGVQLKPDFPQGGVKMECPHCKKRCFNAINSFIWTNR
jgi:hypothetical protein